MRCNEKGVALVNVVLMLSVLLALASVLVEKIWQSTRQVVAADSREQLFWAAQAGVESARRRLAAEYSASGGWQSLLMSTTPLAYPAAPAWSSTVNGQTVEIYVRDNQDEDGDPRRDNDLKVFVLARAVDRRGGEVMVEGLCGFERPAVDTSASSGATGVTDLSDLAEQPSSVYNIVE